ncbi:MAG TPA: hypothetical protein VGU70_17185 [Methylobacterium sp.]|jgi:hypothetical protein|uniref:hypothetical protein n=1 Tax=Methylorubrum sp. B1-46 TaxID=2897334 RepID=UPI001E49EAF8|nr:hypothetical protein [Methylorubrum sp. B1-46]UGB25698.1 hypothetical protein LPC10_22895 [Methylorubrum sp. B1-46]HEV2544489.1 hypothetical protein [Methylobacterium sp.]
MRVVDLLRKPDVSATPRPVLPPFLPTLGLAVVAALLSLACREPAKGPTMEPAGSSRPVPAMAAAPGLAVFDPGKALLADVEAGPASETFARLMPLVAASEAAPAAARPPRVAARPERRRAPASRMVTTQPANPQKNAEPVVPAPAAMARAEEEDDRFLPTGALPFAAVDAAWDAARRAGTGAATGVATGVTSLGSSVVSLVSELR